MIADWSPVASAKALIASQREALDALAEAWVAQGASAFGLLLNDEWVYFHPDGGASDYLKTSCSILLRGHKGELQVYGLEGNAVQARLKADAATLSRLLLLEDELNIMTQDLIDNQEQLLALFELNRSARLRRNLNEALCQMIREIYRLTQVSAISAYFDLAPAIVIQHPDPLYSVETLRLFLDHLREVHQEVVLTAHEHPGILPATTLTAMLQPVVLNNQIVGVVSLFSQRVFHSPELKLARAICDQVETYIENLVLYRDSLQQERLKTEMLLAKEVQQHLLPQQMPVSPGVEIAARSTPAYQIGGDFYDFLSQSGHDFSFMVGDVAGKGVPASMLMAMTRTLMRSKARALLAPQLLEVVEAINHELYDDFTEVGMFATAFLGLYKADEHTLYYANAGQSPIIFRPVGGSAQLLVATGTALGVLPVCECSNQKVALGVGDVLIVATDGLSEATNAEGEIFGYERLLQLVDSLAACTAEDIASRLFSVVEAFSDVQHDDQTVVVLKGTGHG